MSFVGQIDSFVIFDHPLDVNASDMKPKQHLSHFNSFCSFDVFLRIIFLWIRCFLFSPALIKHEIKKHAYLSRWFFRYCRFLDFSVTNTTWMLIIKPFAEFNGWLSFWWWYCIRSFSNVADNSQWKELNFGRAIFEKKLLNCLSKTAPRWNQRVFVLLIQCDSQSYAK